MRSANASLLILMTLSRRLRRASVGYADIVDVGETGRTFAGGAARGAFAVLHAYGGKKSTRAVGRRRGAAEVVA